jgi:phosphonate transport system substrate-binding protein
MENGTRLSEFLQKETGLHFQVNVPSSFIAVVETFGTKRTDIALLNSFGYILANKKYNAHVRLVSTNKGRAEYYGQIITANPKITKLSDLNGKKFAFVDPASTSGFILPSSLFHQKKISIKDTVFAGKHDSVVTMVYQGRVDAGATFHMPEENGEPQDARRLVKAQFPDVYKKVRILERTGPIPSDPVVFASSMPIEFENQIVAALRKFVTRPEGRETLMKLYNVDGFVPASDQTYDSLRTILKQAGKAPEDLIK